MLESAGHRCAVASNSRQAHSLLVEDDFDLVIADLRMPGESGLRLMENARAAQVDVATIILTALDDRKSATAAIDQGAYAYITKPFRINELLVGVDGALRRHRLEVESRRQRQALEEQLCELEEAQRELRRTEEHFRAMAETAVDGIVSTDSEGNVTHLNPAAQLMFGYRPEEILGKPFTLMLAERFQSRYETGLRRFLATGECELMGTTGEIEGEEKERRGVSGGAFAFSVDGERGHVSHRRHPRHQRAPGARPARAVE